MNQRTITCVALFALSTFAHSQGPVFEPLQFRADLNPRIRLFAATDDGGGIGGVVKLRGGPPWTTELVGMTSGARRLRHFGDDFYVVETLGTIWRIPEDGIGLPDVVDVGSFSQPCDVHITTAGTAYATARTIPSLLRVDFERGTNTPVVDLSVLASPDEIASPATLERDGTRLFVQVRFDTVSGPSIGDMRGVLAVVDLVTETLIDTDPVTPGVQGIELQGEPPHLKMQYLPRKRLLLVSATDRRLSVGGGIEKVDLDTLKSVGFAVTEKNVGADVGGFVMTSDEGGYLVFHTDIVASTHLKPFTIAAGVKPGPELFVMLGDTVDTLVYDRQRSMLYIPTARSFYPPTGIYALDTRTNTMLGGPIDTGMAPQDVILAR